MFPYSNMVFRAKSVMAGKKKVVSSPPPACMHIVTGGGRNGQAAGNRSQCGGEMTPAQTPKFGEVESVFMQELNLISL